MPFACRPHQHRQESAGGNARGAPAGRPRLHQRVSEKLDHVSKYIIIITKMSVADGCSRKCAATSRFNPFQCGSASQKYSYKSGRLRQPPSVSPGALYAQPPACLVFGLHLQSKFGNHVHMSEITTNVDAAAAPMPGGSSVGPLLVAGTPWASGPFAP